MVQLSNVPKQVSYLRLAKAKSFSLGLWFRTKDQRSQYGTPQLINPADLNGIDITDDTVRLVIYNKPRFGSTVVFNQTATMVEPENGYCRIDMQGEDTDLVANRVYDFSVTWVSENYSGVVVQGEVEIVPNGEIDSLDDDDYVINPPLTLGVEIDERNHIQVIVDHMRAPDLLIGSVTTLPAGEDAGANFSGAYPHQLLHLRIPRGPGGDPPELEIGTVEVGDNENDADVELVPDGPGSYLMNFVLPRANVDSVGGKIFLDAYPEIVGDNAADDAVAIQAVLDSLDAFGGGTVELGSKTYFIDANDIQVPNGVWLEGLGREVSGFRLGVGRRIRVGVWGDGDRPGGLQKLFVDGNEVSHADGAVHFQSVFAQMLYCKVYDGGGDNILLDAAQNAVILGSYSTTAADAALAIRNGAGGYNFMGSHFTTSGKCLKIYDDDSTANNAYPFGSAHLNFWGGICEQYANGEMVFEIRCSGALHFWGSGFSVNGAITMSEGVVGRISNADFPGISSYVEFNGCTWNGGTNKYVGLEIDGNEYVQFSGENYIQKHTSFVDVVSGSPRIQQRGFFSGQSDVDEIFTASGGSLVSMYNENIVSDDYIVPASRPTIISSRLEGDAGHRFRLEATGKHVFNEGDDFGIQQYFEYNEATDDMLHTSVQMAGRFSMYPLAPIFANGAVNLNCKLRSHFQIVLTGTGHADTVTIDNPVAGAMVLITVYATAGQAITWNANMKFHGGVVPTAPASGKYLAVLATYDDVGSVWLCRTFTDDPVLAASVTPDPPGLAAHIADTDDAHDASAISYAGSTNLVATNVEAALDELDTEKVASSALDELIDDRVAALVTAGTGIRETYDDSGNVETLSAVGSTFNAQTGTTYTLVLTDAGKWITLSNAAAITLTIPTNASVAFTVGDEIDFSAHGAGQVTITPAGGVTLQSRGGRLKTNGQYSVFGMKYLGSNFWLVWGDLTT